ncbi:uncharacterized protein VTP21DRAFT_8532 [Calcarisporiella thermophila]|uniref:uncharacterized protein n=1 Tax=Calcarisporiella thermophila TaxID=911321 RepID=UPI00374479A7
MLLPFIISIVATASSVLGYVPEARFAQACAMQTNKIYCTGGMKIVRNNHTSINEAVYFDLSTSFDTTVPEFRDISSPTLPRFGWGYGAFFKNKFIVFGGGSDAIDHSTRIYTYTPSTDNWSKSFIGLVPPSREGAVAATNDNLFYFGGLQDDFVMGRQTVFKAFDKMWRMNSLYLWDTPLASILSNQGPGVRYDHAMVALGDDRLLILGGRMENGTFVNMNSLFTFDTTLLKWESVSVPGSSPDPRIGHTAVYKNTTNQVIVYGGLRDLKGTPASPALIILNINNGTYSWSSPSGNNLDKPRFMHSAFLVDKYMFVLFGGTQYGTNPPGVVPTSSILELLDTDTWKWTTSYTPPASLAGNSSKGGTGYITGAEGGLSTGAIIGIGVGAGFLLIAGAAIVFILIRRRKTQSPPQAVSGNMQSTQPPYPEHPPYGAEIPPPPYPQYSHQPPYPQPPLSPSSAPHTPLLQHQQVHMPSPPLSQQQPFNPPLPNNGYPQEYPPMQQYANVAPYQAGIVYPPHPSPPLNTSTLDAAPVSPVQSSPVPAVAAAPVAFPVAPNESVLLPGEKFHESPQDTLPPIPPTKRFPYLKPDELTESQVMQKPDEITEDEPARPPPTPTKETPQ